jgi:hypothetical protein
MIRQPVFARAASVAFATASLALISSAQSTFAVTGAGGAFPTSTSGTNGVYPHANQTGTPALPPNAFSSTVTVPAGASRITSVVLRGLRHTWSGDAHFILKDPTGVRFNVACPVNTWNSTIYGTGCDYGATVAGSDYTFVDPSVPALDFPPMDNASCNGPAGAYHLPGTYHQYFNNGNGAWPNSLPNNCGVLNVHLQSIPVTPGTWTLECYDWYLLSDSGTFTSWELRGDLTSQPASYCTAGTSTSGCVPSIGASAQPSVTLANACSITVANLEGQKTGLLFYGIDNSAFTPVSWGAGTSYLCVKAPTQRTPTQVSGGTLGGCNGQLVLDWNAYQSANPSALGNPWLAGAKVYAQGWYRDPASAKTTNLSDALEMTYQP